MLRFRRDNGLKDPTAGVRRAPRTGYAVAIVGDGLRALAAAHALATQHRVSDVVVLGTGGAAADGGSPWLRVHDAAPPLMDVYREARRWWRRFVPGRHSLAIRPAGHLALAHDGRAVHDLRFAVHAAAVEGVPARLLDREDIRHHCPDLAFLDGTRLAVSAGALQADAMELPVQTGRRRLYAAVARAGVTVLPDLSPSRLCVNAGRITGIRTARGVIHADCVVLAAPDRNQRLAASAGLTLPVSATQLERVTTLPLAPWLAPAVASWDLGVEIWQSRNGRMTLLGADAATRAVALLPRLAAATVAQARPVFVETTPDGLPALGRLAAEGLVLDGGWGGASIWAAPVAGALVANVVTGAATDRSPFAPGRASGRDLSLAA